MPITHAFTSAKSDGADATLVRASNWNAAHTGQSTGRVASNITVTSSTTYVNATGISFAIGASETWFVQIAAIFALGGTSKSKTHWTVPAGATGPHWYDSGGFGGSIQSAVGTDLISANAGSATYPIEFYATITNSTTAGTAQWQFAQWTADGVSCVLQAGSFLIATKL